MERLVIFGTGQIAELAHYYFLNDSNYKVAAFTVDSEFIESDIFCGLPVIPFDSVHETFPASENEMFVALSYAKMNRVRRDKVAECRAKGYTLASYVSSKAVVFDNVPVGYNCFILENNVVQPFVKVGNNCTLWSGNHIGHHSVIEDDCFISSHVVISGGVTVGRGCFLGVNATIRDHVTLGEETLVGMGGIIVESTEPRAVFIANKLEPRSVTSDKIKKL